MHAGTLALLDSPADDTLDPWARTEGEVPAFDVQNTQETLADFQGAVQTGAAAARVYVSEPEILVSGTHIERESTETVKTVYSGWTADVTGSGIVLSESVAADDKVSPFPFDMFTARTGRECKRHAIDVDRLSDAWADDDALTAVWMVASEDEFEEGVSIDYGENATLDDVGDATIGLGFKRTFQGSSTRGVVYAGGYVSCYRDWPAPQFVRFVEHEIVPFAREYEPDDEQVDFEEVFS